MKRILTAWLLAASILTISPSVVQGAVTWETPGLIQNDLAIVTDGFRYKGENFTLNGTAYVSLREFACWVDNSVVSWDHASESAPVETDSLPQSAAMDSQYMIANGRILWCDKGIFTLDGILYVPLRQTAQAFGFETAYDAADHTAYLTRRDGAILPGEEYYDADDLYWLSKIIHAESQGEPFLGKIAVGNVVLNRVEAEEFPDCVYDVIFDSKNGVQFTPTANGAISQKPGEESVLAAQICLEENRIWDEILYFLNIEKSTNLWIVENCTHIMSIGDHDFYAP